MKHTINPLMGFAERTLSGLRVLVVEPNPYHGEILPGYTHLFQKAGYEVDVLMRNEVAKENPFVAYPKDKLPKIYSVDATSMEKALSYDLAKSYEIVFFSTNVYWVKDKNHSSLLRYLGIAPAGRLGSLFVEHNLMCAEEDDTETLFAQGRVFTLLEYKYKKKTTKMLNPHYFGELDKTKVAKRNLNAQKILLLGSSSVDPINLNRLFDSLRRIKANHIVTIVGGTIEIPEDLSAKVICVGHLNFADFYRLICAQDYLLTLVDLDSDDIIHKKYLNGTTTGTVQISLGFTKPMILDEEQAKAYSFTSDESIVYKKGDLLGGIQTALETHGKKYDELKNNLYKKANEVESVSLNNLRGAMKYQKKKYFWKRIRNEDNIIMEEIEETYVSDVDNARYPIQAAVKRKNYINLYNPFRHRR